MAEVLPLPRLGEIFVDARDPGRTMRVSHHPDRGLVIVSLWAGTTCRASFQLRVDDAAGLAELLHGIAPDPASTLPAGPGSEPDEPAVIDLSEAS